MSLSITPKSATAYKLDQELSFTVSGSNSSGNTAVHLKLYFGSSSDPSGDFESAQSVWSTGGGLANYPGLIIDSNSFSNSSSSGSMSFKITPEIAGLYSAGSVTLTFFILWQKMDYDYVKFTVNYNPTTAVGAPTNPHFDSTLSREPVRFSWGGGSDGNGGNNVTGYDVQYQDSADGVTWPNEWTEAYGSPVSGTEMLVGPPAMVGYYRRLCVRTRGSISEELHSSWVISTNTLRHKWDAFPAWTDPTLTARTTYIRAVHLTEMQERINFIRTFLGKSAYSFTAVKAGETKIAKWAALIDEMRAAIDDAAGARSDWNTLEAGKPRIAHITQLRSVIDNW